MTYINAAGERPRTSIRGGVVAWDYPPGTVIVKAGFLGSSAPGRGETPSKLYAMIKKPADPLARGGWVWVVSSAGKESVMDAAYCVDCHGYANQPNPYGDKNPGAEFRDYVYLPYRPDAESR